MNGTVGAAPKSFCPDHAKPFTHLEFPGKQQA